jgi:hypothetical protein
MPDPKPEVTESVFDPQPLPDETPDDDEHERTEEHVGASPLPPRLLSPHERSQEEPAGYPGRRHPEDHELQVPRP